MTVNSPIEDAAARYSGEPIYLADLDRCEPASALGPWRSGAAGMPCRTRRTASTAP